MEVFEFFNSAQSWDERLPRTSLLMQFDWTPKYTYIANGTHTSFGCNVERRKQMHPSKQGITLRNVNLSLQEVP